MQKLILCCLSALASCSAIVTARAQANLTFGGGNGTPLTLTLTSDVVYTVTSSSGNAPKFVFDGVAGAFASGPSVSGSILYSINGGTNHPFSILEGNGPFSDIYGDLPGVTVGNVITLKAGTLMTTTGYNSEFMPASGSYTTYIGTGPSAASLSTNGLAVPEPSIWALLGASAICAGVMRRRSGFSGPAGFQASSTPTDA